MNFRFSYKTYQDVRHNTVLYFLPVIYILSFTFYYYILPTSYKIEIDKFIGNILTENLIAKFWIKGISNILIFSIISFFLIEILKIHDLFYDRYIIRWRKYYDRDFILPRLCKPFLSSTNSDRFFEEANLHKGKFMQELYYYFVGDEAEKINKNTRIRFYEVITIYWFTQINELIFLITFLTINILAIYTQDTLLLKRLPFYILFLIFLTIINWLWKRANHPKVENATTSQINEIHSSQENMAELKNKFIEICDNYKIPFNA